MNERENAQVIRLKIPVAPDYHAESFSLFKTEVDLVIPLTDGVHIQTTHPVIIGHLQSDPARSILAQLSIWYEYHEEDEMIIFCGNDYASERSIHLVSWLDGSIEKTVQYVYPDAKEPDLNNLAGNSGAATLPELREMFHTMISAANNMIIATAEKHDLNTVELGPLPEVSNVDIQDLYLVYRNGVFDGYYDPEEKYGEEYEIVHPLSVYKGTILFKISQELANVIHSTKDPKAKGYKTWIRLWKAKCNFDNPPNKCTSFNLNSFVCNNRIIGGHVVLGKIAKPVKTGANGLVYISPICSNHNANNKVYMEPIIYQKAVILNKYFQKGPVPV